MSNTLSDKTNKSIADIANKIMQEQPTKMRDFSDTKPIESDMVQRVMNLKVPNHFVKEDAEQLDELSKKTLSSYVGKAYWDQGKRVSKAGQAYGYIAGTERRKATHGEISNAIGGKKEVRRDKSRDKGVERALSRLAKEEAEQIDEISDSLLRRAKNKADYNKMNTNDSATFMKNQDHEDNLSDAEDKRSARRRRLGIPDDPRPAAAPKKKLNFVQRMIKNHKDEKEAGERLKRYVRGVNNEEVEQIDEALDHEVNNYAKHMLNAHSADDLHVGNEHRDMAHQTLKHIEKHYGPVGVRWAEARAGEHIEKHNSEHRDAEKASIMKRYKPTPPGAKVYQYPKSEVKETAEQINEGRFGKAIDRSKLSAAARARLEARDKKAGKEAPKAEPAPTSAAVGKRAGRAAPKAKESPMAALAQSFGAKKKTAKVEPEKVETPAQKVRRQNIERQKEYYAKGGSRSGMNVGSGGRTSITGHNTSTAGGAVNAVKSQGRIKTGGLHSIAVDEDLKGNQTALDVAKPYGKLTAQDFKALRAKHKKGN